MSARDIPSTLFKTLFIFYIQCKVLIIEVTMPKQYPCILTLDPAIGIITNATDMVAYTIRQFFGTPGRISDVFSSDEIISFREIKSTFNDNIDAICNKTQSALLKVLRTLIPADEIDVECNLINVYGDNRYNLRISVVIVTAVNGISVREPILTTADVAIENDEFVIKMKGDR